MCLACAPNPCARPCSALWTRSLLERGGSLTPDLDLSSLAKVTDGYTQGSILQAVRVVLTQRRLEMQGQRPLSALEFIPSLARLDPVYKDEEETFKVSAGPAARKGLLVRTHTQSGTVIKYWLFNGILTRLTSKYQS